MRVKFLWYSYEKILFDARYAKVKNKCIDWSHEQLFHETT